MHMFSLSETVFRKKEFYLFKIADIIFARCFARHMMLRKNNIYALLFTIRRGTV